MNSISDYIDAVRQNIDHKKKEELQQYFSSIHVSKMMASMMDYEDEKISILDPGAGIGSLFAACVDEIASRDKKPEEIAITAYEIDESLFGHITDALEQCEILCKKIDVSFSGRLVEKNFLAESTGDYTHVILNPPYQKINRKSTEWKIMNDKGLESPNLYSAFVDVSQKMLKDGGQMAFITPRSFCNGKYFLPFRTRFLESMNMRRIHVFDSRSSSFDGVLQENVIIHAKKSKNQGSVEVSSSPGPGKCAMVRRVDSVVYPDDPQHFIHIIPDEIGAQISERMNILHSSLTDLGIEVSTGKVVDFRIREALRHHPNDNTIPLIRPQNLVNGSILFPVPIKQENYIEITPRSKKLLVDNEIYVLVKRFSTKEERRRVVASVFDADFPTVGFEIRVNYFYGKLDRDIAAGLSIFLNSTIVDSYFRHFSGGTQVNATDLRYIKYPTCEQLKELGMKVQGKYPEQKEIDRIVDNVLFSGGGILPILAQEKINDAMSILKELRVSHNEMSGIVLLALLGLKPGDSWDTSTDSPINIYQIMRFFEIYGRKYKSNCKETARGIVRQFVEAEFVEEDAYGFTWSIGCALSMFQSFDTLQNLP